MSFFEKLVLINKHENLNEFINDENYHIRMHVAKQGYGLEKLIGDSHDIVRDAVVNYCKKHLYDKECKRILTLYKI